MEVALILLAMALLLISFDIRDRIKHFLKEKAKTQRPLTVEDALKSIRSSVNKMLKRGFDYSDVVTALSEHNVSVSLEVIETFYAPIKKEKGKRGAKKKARREKVPELEQPVSKVELEAIVARFQELAKSRKGLSVRELVADLFEVIDEDLAAGWRYEDIARWIKGDFGIEIASGTLKRYHSTFKRGQSGEGEAKGEVKQGSEELSAAPKEKRLQEAKEVPAGQQGESRKQLVAMKQGRGDQEVGRRPSPQQTLTSPVTQSFNSSSPSVGLTQQEEAKSGEQNQRAKKPNTATHKRRRFSRSEMSDSRQAKLAKEFNY